MNTTFSITGIQILDNKNIKKARHPVELFRMGLLDMTPVVSHDPDA